MTARRNSGAKAWQHARTLEDLGELTAEWIEGRLGYHPCYAEGPNCETKKIETYLADFNRRGLVTTHSQPAEPIDESGSGQRACVEGYADEDLAKRIATLGLYTDLLVFIFEPEGDGGYQVPISTWEFHPYTWCGGCWGYEGLECFEAVCAEEALRALKAGWKVVVIDLKWGRKEHLWRSVSRVIRGSQNPRKPYSIEPSPDLSLDRDFVR